MTENASRGEVPDNRTQRRPIAKQIVIEQLANEEPENAVLSVKKGPSSGWLTIKTRKPVRDYTKGWIEAHLVAAGLVGRYYTDYGCGVDGYAVCSHWKVAA